MNTLEEQYKSACDAAQTIIDEAAGKAMSDQQLVDLEKYNKSALALQRQIEAKNVAESAKKWGNEGVGSYVASAMKAPPMSGEMPGVTADPKTGEMFAFKGYGEEKIKALKAGQYKDALDDYVRRGNGNDEYKRTAMKVLNEGGFTTGEAWLPPDFRPQIIQKMATMTTIRPNATVMTTGTDAITFPSVAYTSDDLYTTGIRPVWRNSNPLSSGITEATNPIAGNMKIPVNLLTFAIIVTREQAEDNSFDILGFITSKMSESAALFTENAYWNGTGDGQPQGVATHPSMFVARGSTTTVGGLTIQGQYIKSNVNGQPSWQGVIGSEDPTKGILGLEGDLPPQYENGAKFYAHKKTFGAIRGLVDTQKRPLWNLSDGQWANWVRGYPPTLVGYPIERSQFLPVPSASATYNLAFLGDLSGYYIVDRVGLSVEVNRDIYMDRDQILVYARMRTGGQLMDYWKVLSMYASV